MRFTTASTTTWILMAAWVVPTTKAQLLAGLFNVLFRPFVQSACDFVTSSLGLDSTLDCACDVLYKGLFQGFAGDVECTLDQPRCLVPPDLYCATGSIGASLEGSLLSGTGLTAEVEACFDVKSGLPRDVLSIPDICFSFIPQGVTLSTCSVSVGDTKCNSCEICASGVDFKFNCSNVDLVPESNAIFVPGPVFASCIGLSLIPTNVSVRV